MEILNWVRPALLGLAISVAGNLPAAAGPLGGDVSSIAVQPAVENVRCCNGYYPQRHCYRPRKYYRGYSYYRRPYRSYSYYPSYRRYRSYDSYGY